MTQIISMKAAGRIWSAHREIEAAGKLLADIQETLKGGRCPTPVDPFGRQRTFQLGVPSENGHRLLDVMLIRLTHTNAETY